MKTSSPSPSSISNHQALQEKSLGNVAFRSGDFCNAVSHYESALSLLRQGAPATTRTPTATPTQHQLEVDVLNNLALALVRIGRASEAIAACKQVLTLDANNCKATWRWAVALEDDCRFAEAIEVLQRLQWLQWGTSDGLTMSERERVGAKLRSLRRNAEVYEAPKLADCERQSWLNKQQRLRLSIKGKPFPEALVAGERVVIRVELYVSNEFGLFDHAALPSAPRVVCQAISCACAELHEEDGLHVAVQGDLTIATGKAVMAVYVHPSKAAARRSFMLRFGCEGPTDVHVLPVLSLPIRVVEEMDELQTKEVEEWTALEASCCREISLNVELERHLLVLESQGQLGIPGKLWDSALVLIDFIKDNPRILGNKILELGAGTGAVGLACAAISRKCKGHVTITDLHHVIPLLEANVRLNTVELGSNVKAEVCEWGVTQLVETFDMVVMSDVVYDPPAYRPLIQTLEQVSRLEVNECRILWSHRHRNPNDHEFFSDFHKEFVTYKIDGPGPKFIVEQDERLLEAFNTPYDGHLNLCNNVKSTANHSSSDVSIYLSTLRPSKAQ